MAALHSLLPLIGFAALVIAVVYGTIALVALVYWHCQPVPARAGHLPPVTLLKPLCGAEPGLYEHLRGFCVQNYPDYQIVFGVRDAADPACDVVGRLMREYPHLPMELVVDPRQHGSNLKVSNLINMLGRARHDLLVMADSDAFVGADYLGIVAAPLLDPAVGLVTCAYRGVPTEDVWSRLGAMYINEWYVPTVLLAWLFGYEGYVSGQTMCTRQDTLRAVGGLEAVADHLADDHRLGALVSALGLRIVLSPYLVQGEHFERDYASLARHETRWMRTLHVLRPRSFRMIFLTFSMPLALLGLLCTLPADVYPGAAWTLFAMAVVIRLAFYLAPRIQGRRPLFADLWLLPVRDVLLCWIWFRTFFASNVTWRGSEFVVDADGFMRKLT